MAEEPSAAPAAVEVSVLSTIRCRFHPDRFELRPDVKGTINRCGAGLLRYWSTTRPIGFKVIVVSQVEAMNAAQNALLKTLEEPPAETLFVLTTTRYQGFRDHSIPRSAPSLR